MTLIAVKTAQPAALVHDGCPAMHGTGCVCAPASNTYVRLTRVVYDGNRATGPVYVNRHQVTDVTDDHKGKVFINFIGERSVQVAESLECVVEKLHGAGA